MAKKGIYIWTCDHCGKQETWKKGWSYLPGIESDANKLTDGLILPASFCCPKHADEWLDARHPIYKNKEESVRTPAAPG